MRYKHKDTKMKYNFGNNVQVVEVRRAYDTEYNVNGPKEEVEKFIEHICDRYHPAGYGTAVKHIVTGTDGHVVAVVQRFNSCD